MNKKKYISPAQVVATFRPRMGLLAGSAFGTSIYDSNATGSNSSSNLARRMHFDDWDEE